MCVLLVDDDDSIRELLIDVLSDEGHSVTVAKDGKDALDCLASAPIMPRLILLDLNMPVMNGWQFAQAVLAHPVFVSIPIVVMSAGTELERASRGLTVAGALPKPIDLDQLLATIERYCG